MFKPFTDRIRDLATRQPEVIKQLEGLFIGRTNVYIDFANVLHWAESLGWSIDLKRLYQFLRSFDNVQTQSFYMGTLNSDSRSEQTIKDAQDLGYRVRTKSVKIMSVPINVSSISSNSPDIIKRFIRKSLLRKLDTETVEFLNSKLQGLNRQGIFLLEERKCNFDVEIGRDITLDHERRETDCFVLWSGDSDFHDPVKELLDNGRKVVLCATSGRVAAELNILVRRGNNGLFIFDIVKIRNFICYKRQIV